MNIVTIYIHYDPPKTQMYNGSLLFLINLAPAQQHTQAAMATEATTVTSHNGRIQSTLLIIILETSLEFTQKSCPTRRYHDYPTISLFSNYNAARSILKVMTSGSNNQTIVGNYFQ